MGGGDGAMGSMVLLDAPLVTALFVTHHSLLPPKTLTLARVSKLVMTQPSLVSI